MAKNPWEVISGRNERMAELLERNHSISQYFMDVLSGVLDWCDEHGAKFEDVVVQEAFITETGERIAYIRGRISAR